LNVSFKAPHSCAELAGLDAPNHAVEVLGVRGSETEHKQRAVISRLTQL
jgi:hypothetical protein